jgi:hypothetical protein
MTEQSITLSWRDGDVYFWRYRKEPEDFTLGYWCCARKAIVRRERLVDLYWLHIHDHNVSSSGEGRSWTLEETKKRLILEYKGNLDQFDVISDYLEPLYDVADILNLRHASSSQKQIYLRKGAVRSKERMLEHCRYLREKAESALRSAQRDIERYAEIEAKIDAGADLKEIYL